MKLSKRGYSFNPDCQMCVLIDNALFAMYANYMRNYKSFDVDLALF